MYLIPSETGIGPMISIWTSWKQGLTVGGVSKGGRMTLCGLHLLKGMQVATYSAKSFRMVGQRAPTFLRVSLDPG